MTGSLTYLRGDATNPRERPAIIAHVCNDVGAWGAGFTQALSWRWPGAEKLYREQKNRVLGSVSYHTTFGPGRPVTVANMVAQHGVGRGVRRLRDDALRSCLTNVSEVALPSRASVHMPRIGCGLAGATWDEVEPIVRACLVDRGVNVFVYDLGAK